MQNYNPAKEVHESDLTHLYDFKVINKKLKGNHYTIIEHFICL